MADYFVWGAWVRDAAGILAPHIRAYMTHVGSHTLHYGGDTERDAAYSFDCIPADHADGQDRQPVPEQPHDQ